MVHKRIRIPRQNAVDIMNKLGQLENAIEFIDLNKEDYEAKKNYQSLINRTEELDLKLNYFEKLAGDYGHKFEKYQEFTKFLFDLDIEMKQRGVKADEYLDYIEAEIVEDEKKILEQRLVYEKTKESFESLLDKASVYKKAKQLSANIDFQVINRMEDQSRDQSRLEENIMGEEGIYMQSNLLSISGIIKLEDEMRLKKMVFRASKGRAIPTFFELEDQNEFNNQTTKKIFNIFFQGGYENVLKQRLLKICDLFNCSRFNIPSPEKIHDELEELLSELSIKRKLLVEAEKSIKNFVELISGTKLDASKFDLYRNFLRMKKMIYVNLNKCIVRDNFIDGEVWIPENKFNLIQAKMQEILQGNEVGSTANFYDITSNDELKPPTYLRTNEFLWAFQEIVNTYGIPRYREINPTFFNIVTFPFLFGIMFGDIGHGFILFCFGIYLCLYNDSLKVDENWKFACKARYLLLMMGFFAFFAGLIYNDFLSIPLQTFSSCYEIIDKTSGETRKIPGCEYYFGVDYRWFVSHNELTFVNSLKMKTSVIFGVAQMIFGIVLKCLNAIHYENKLDLLLEGIPQLLFMIFLFGYMNALIILKWSVDWTESIKAGIGAPSIITQMMNFIIGMGSIDINIWGTGNQQQIFHYFVLIIVVICVPVMLLPKPIILYCRLMYNRSLSAKANPGFKQFEEEENAAPYYLEVDKAVINVNNANNSKDEHKEEHKESFGELFIHQSIETIEFVLGSVSNTASYLRLWALSLAHGQLSKVIYQKTLGSFIIGGNFALIFAGYLAFAHATFGILLMMDLMECFLHTLRLHWVEFQNKFYKADGYLFAPFSFKRVVEREDS